MDRLNDYIVSKRKIIRSTLRDFFAEKEKEFFSVNDIGGNLCKRLLEFSLEGKMIRGVLVFLGYEIFTPPIEDLKTSYGSVLKHVAGAMEILQSGLLIHDDVMDRDLSRRGKDSFHVQYRKYIEPRVENKGTVDILHSAESLAICAGDIAFFLSFELLTYGYNEDVPDKLFKRIVNLLVRYSRELSLVGIGQMEDVILGLSDENIGIDRILNLYRYKTSRYTFSLPLIMGAMIAEVGAGIVSVLNEIGENLGILFQIRDDELGIFGDEERLGKPIGSDIREGKRNLIYVLLKDFIRENRIRKRDAARINALWGNRDIGEKDVLFVREVVKTSGVLERLDAIVKKHSKRIFAGVESLRNLEGVFNDKIDILEEFVNFVLKREK